MQNHSPWLEELDPNFSLPKLNSDQKSDIIIIGGGFSGLVSAYFILNNTSHSLVLLESHKLGHGASGHNAGHLSSNLETTYQHLNQLFGPKISKYTQKILDSSWKHLKTLFLETKIKQSCHKFSDYDAYADPKHVILQLEESFLKKTHKLPTNIIYLSNSCYLAKSLEKKYQPFYKLVDQCFINKKIKTKDYSFIAIQKYNFGILNSALFCQNLAKHILKEYSTRIKIFEHTPALKFKHTKALVKTQTENNKITSKVCLFCTNGYNLKPVNKLFVQKTAHMLGHLGKSTSIKPQAKGYYLKHDDDYYVTRRPFLGKNLFTFGGPEIHSRTDTTAKFIKENQSFLKNYTNYSPALYAKKLDYTWSGYLAYTPHRLRLSGQDKSKGRYWYNVGCNGIGLLPSLACAHRISLQLAGKKLPPSAFDP